MTLASLSVSGYGARDDSELIEDFDRAHVDFGGFDYEPTCADCGNPIIEAAHGWEHDTGETEECVNCGAGIERAPKGAGVDWQHVEPAFAMVPNLCRVDEESDAEEGDIAEPAHDIEPLDTGVSTWANSAAIAVEDDGAYSVVRTSISVGDPRGAFAFAVTRGPNGSMRLSVPDPSDGMPHEGLVRRGPGFFEVVPYSAAMLELGQLEATLEDAIRRLVRDAGLSDADKVAAIASIVDQAEALRSELLKDDA